MNLSGILFFPVTPFTASGAVALDRLEEHVSSRLPFSPGAVFAACGTGEFHALSAAEVRSVVAATVRVVGDRVPVVAGTGGPLGHAIECARAAEEEGADALLVLPPYLVGASVDGTVAYVRALLDATALPVVLYHRGSAQFTPEAMAGLATDPRVIGFKDGVGDLGTAQTVVRAVQGAGRDDFLFFNGLLTAEISQGAYRGVGVPLYSSAAFAMAPEVATAYYEAYTANDEARRLALLDVFYAPLVRLRDRGPGYAVSLIKAGLRLTGSPVGSVRPPLLDPAPEHERELARILDAGRAFIAG